MQRVLVYWLPFQEYVVVEVF
ncbi:MAG: hypothetical protein JWO22_4123, partial [Frankiales bacterium]|nr:hypothetical protein [Frankiales bacterium]